MTELAPGYVRVLIEQPRHPALESAARALATGENPSAAMREYEREKRSDLLTIDVEFGAIPIGPGGGNRELSRAALDPGNSERFLVRGFIRANTVAQVPEQLDGELIYSDPLVGAQLVCAASRPVCDTAAVKQKLDTATLGQHGLDGAGVAVAIVDSGIYLPHLTKLLKYQPALDVSYSWKPDPLTTTPGMNRIGHGTMCAYDALIAAPKATLLDIPILKARAPGDHSAQGTVGAAMQAFWRVIADWVFGKPKYSALVINNSWGVLHPSLDFPATHPQRYIDNPYHIFRLYIQFLTLMGADVVFAASNCGADCPTAVCLGERQKMIMGANAYPEVLTLGGCDLTDTRVGYSSQGPSIPNMPLQKPDLTAYTHFLGSKTFRSFIPDTGTSAACAVAAGCVAALRTRLLPSATPPGNLFNILKATAKQVGAAGWNADYGHGIIRPVAAGRSLGLIP